MPRETDAERVKAIVGILLDDTGGELFFTERAHSGHHLEAEPNDLGLAKVFPPDFTRAECERCFRRAMADAIAEGGGKLNKLDEDYGTVYELRFTYLAQHRLYVKMIWDDDDASSIELVVMSVKKQD